ncbi:MAG: hypothetical protein WBA88_23955 [Pseudaminobacter sp.]
MSRAALQDRLRAVERKGLHLSAGGQEAMARTRLNGVEIAGGYRHVYDNEGRKVETVRWNAPKAELALETVLERAANVFASLPKAPAIPVPKTTNADLLTLYPCFDIHYGMRAWSDETGYDDYDTKLAASDLNMALGNVMALSPDSEEAIVLIGGDFFHGDDNTNQTPRSHNPLDVDGRHFKVLDTGIEVVAATVERAASKHRRVTVRVLRGNHDEHSHMVLTLALAQRYRDHARIVVDKDPRDIFMHQWGKCLIAAHHGDKQKPERLAMVLAEICPFWSAAPHRIVFTGHKHHQQSNDFPGIEWEQFRAFCPPDAYGAQFAPRRAMHAITFHKESGIATRAKDPIQRAA